VTRAVAQRPDGLDEQDIVRALRSLRRGDFRVRLPSGQPGRLGEIADAINDVADLNERTSIELARVFRTVGREGRTGQRASIGPARGAWERNIESVNGLIADLTESTFEVSRVLEAVARGDLSQHMALDIDGRPLRGAFRRTGQTVNTMVDQLSALASEVTRVAREVGTEGILGGQADVKGVGGTWKDLTDNVNSMAANLTSQVRNIADVTTAVARGDLSKKITVDVHGEILELKNTINTMVDQLNAFASEVTRVAREVGTEGKLGGQAEVRGVAGTWKDLTDNVNTMAGNLTDQVRGIARVVTAVARGDLSNKITVDVEGEILELKNTVNTMVDQLNAFASEVTRVAREVGTEGKLGGQAQVPGVGGTWKDLTDNVNSMAANLTAQVRNIARVTTAVAHGDLTGKLTLEAKGEIAELADTINDMTDTLATFADQVSTVAREVGIEGKLGGQAHVPGAAGTWRNLTDNVNQLAANLTTQVRAISEVATAVARGDLSRTIQVEVEGELELLKDNINEMIRNLRDTTRKNDEQYWLKTNLARFGGLLQGQRDLRAVGRLILSELAPLVGTQRGVFYLVETKGDERFLTLLANYAAPEAGRRLGIGEGLIGQCARDRRRILLTDVPPDYIAIKSGLGQAAPHSIVILPVVTDGETKAVIELASFGEFSEVHLSFLDQLTESIAIVLSSMAAGIRTEQLLREQAARAEAEAGLARLRQVVDVMPEGILIADALGEVYLSNAAAEQIMGTVPATVIPALDSLPTVRRLDGSECDPEDMPLARAVFGRQVVLGEQLVVTNTQTGREVPILVNSAPLSDALGVPVGGVAVFQDISPLRDLERQKDEFLAAVSHDLKTPATIIMGRANLLQRALARGDGSDNGSGGRAGVVEFEEGLQSIDESTAQLVRLVDELLDVTRLRMGQPVELDLGPADIVKIARRLAAEYQKMSPRHVIHVDTDLNRLVGDWDEARVERVIANLLSNAVKYSPKGGPIVVGASSEKRDGQEWAILRVQDRGMGIPPDELTRVFEPYYRGTNAAAKTSGTGVGLAGTRHIVEQHGGTISVESVVGEMTTFTVSLPLSRERVELVEA
jgi:hypothetical protein